MASIEYIEKRIAGKEKEIAKLEKKIARILKAKENNWENNPYYYDENDLKYAERDLTEAKDRLAKYMDDLEEANRKANSRNVTAIIEFLNQWKERTIAFYIESYDQYKEELAEYYKADKEYCKWFNSRARHEASNDERKARRQERMDAKKAFAKKWGWMMPYVEYNELDMEKLTRDINNEADRKYDFIIERTVAITGTITDATNIHVGMDGELNGYIIGEDGVAKVQTIGAGGWNIQRYHFRTLVHEMK